MSLPGAAPMMGGNDVSQEQMMAMQNEQMKDFLKSYNKTTQVGSLREKKLFYIHALKRGYLTYDFSYVLTIAFVIFLRPL